jgi:disease resistance protein
MDSDKKCMNPGCGKFFKDSENSDNCCFYHDGNPIFHDVKKGWTCCNQVVYDWDEFSQLKGCKIGSHSDVKKDTNFFKSSTITNAEKGIENFDDTQPQIKIKSISEFEEEQKAKEAEKRKREEEMPKEVVVSINIYNNYIEK